ncbi:MAG: Rid family detoxifying hydrolase [Bdellovibrionota bacterium]
MVDYITDADAPEAIGPYSQATVAGGFAFLSGQIPIDPKTSQLVEGGIEAQCKQVMSNLRAVLSRLELGFKDVVRAEIFLKDMNDFQVVNTIYGDELGGVCPARQTVEVARLPRDVLVEISMIAVTG